MTLVFGENGTKTDAAYFSAKSLESLHLGDVLLPGFLEYIYYRSRIFANTPIRKRFDEIKNKNIIFRSTASQTVSNILPEYLCRVGPFDELLYAITKRKRKKNCRKLYFTPASLWKSRESKELFRFSVFESVLFSLIPCFFSLLSNPFLGTQVAKRVLEKKKKTGICRYI